MFQFAGAHQVHLIQLTPNSIKCLVAAVILNEVEDKKICLAVFLFALRINQTPVIKNAPICSFQTYYLSSNAPQDKKYYMYNEKLSTDKDWEYSGGLFVFSGSWALPNYDCALYPMATNFKNGECFDLHFTFLLMFSFVFTMSFSPFYLDF